MFGFGFSEIVLILIVALLVFGPKRLPEIARTLGKTMGELRRTLDDIKHEVNITQSINPLTPSEASLESAKSRILTDSPMPDEPMPDEPVPEEPEKANSGKESDGETADVHASAADSSTADNEKAH